METLKLVQWLGINCFSELKQKAGVWNNAWAFKEDAANLYDGDFDDRLQWYSSEEILELYNKKYGQ